MRNAWGGNYIDAAVVRWHDNNWDGDYADPCDTVLYYTYDGNFNVTGLVKTDGTVFERYAYAAYGAVAVLEADFSADPDNTPDGDFGYGGLAPYGRNEILYCGYRLDPESGLFHVRHRYYHPRLGRWINRDPVGYVDGMNILAYLKGSPCSGLDPYGLWTVQRIFNVRIETHHKSLQNEWLPPEMAGENPDIIGHSVVTITGKQTCSRGVPTWEQVSVSFKNDDYAFPISVGTFFGIEASSTLDATQKTSVGSCPSSSPFGSTLYVSYNIKVIDRISLFISLYFVGTTVSTIDTVIGEDVFEFFVDCCCTGMWI